MSKPTYEQLEQTVLQLEQTVLELRAQVQQLLAKIDHLEARLNKNSKNSSKPPSSDQKPNIPPQNGSDKSTARHPGVHRQLLPEDMVTSREVRQIKTCPRCRSKMEPTGGTSKWQQIDLPPIKPLVHQIELITCQCPNCHLLTTPQLTEHEALLLSPRVEGLINLLMAQFRQGHQPVRAFLSLLVPGLVLSQGLISKIKRRAAHAFDHATSEITEAILRLKEPKYSDATGWRHFGKNYHALILRAGSLIRYSLVEHQNSATIAGLLSGGPHRLVSDRGFATGQVSLLSHQYCLAHLLRNIQGAAENPATTQEETQILGEVHETVQGLFHDKHRHERAELSRSTFLRYGYEKWGYIRESLEELAAEGSHLVLKRFCKKALSHWKRFMVYLATDGPMTNNLAEEGLRNLVIARKLCFGSRSEYGREWRERVQSCMETLCRQGKSALDFFTEVIRAYRMGTPYPRIA